MRYCVGLLAAVLCSVVLSEGFSSMPTPTTTQSTRIVGNPVTFLPSSSTMSTTTTRHTANRIGIVSPRGGATTAKKSTTTTSLFVSKDGEPVACPFTKTMAVFGSVWGSFGVIYILAKAVKRVIPIAMEPFAGGSLTFTPFQWSMYALSCLFFAYAEGYKGFHLKFSPLVVKRSFTLVIGTPQGNNPLNYILAPLYSMGLFAATRKRLITSWSVTLGVAAIVAAVKRLPLVSRCIVDAGVIAGLTLGSLSIVYHFVKSVTTGELPKIDPCLPSTADKSKSTTATEKKSS